MFKLYKVKKILMENFSKSFVYVTYRNDNVELQLKLETPTINMTSDKITMRDPNNYHQVIIDLKSIKKLKIDKTQFCIKIKFENSFMQLEI